MNVTIIGTGKMARGLGSRLLESGHHVTLVGHTPGKAEALVEELKGRTTKGSISVAIPDTLPGEIVILAVPYPAVESVVRHYLELLPGKILVDITNPVDFQKMEMIVSDGSAAEEIARIAPVSTHVVKAFNTLFARPLLDRQMDCGPMDVFIAGNDADARATIARLAEDIGLRPIDVGPLKWARQIEAMELLHMAIQSSSNLGFKSAIKIVS